MAAMLGAEYGGPLMHVKANPRFRRQENKVVPLSR